MSEGESFTREMGARLGKIRLAAMLTQAKKADRMGLKGKWRGLGNTKAQRHEANPKAGIRMTKAD
jgi:hypothetical protein